jgi:lantibiotic biosynthesis protein
MITAVEALDVAQRIAARLVRTARWDGDSCAWDQFTRHRQGPVGEARSTKQLTGPWIYSGTAGIALFLLEAYRIVGDDSLLRTASGALAHARANMREEHQFSFYAGPIGVAYAYARRGKVLASKDDLAFARSVLASSAGREGMDRSFDVIGGAAGSIPALIRLAEDIPDGLPIEIATRLGENLIRSATRGRYGWSWEGSRSSARDLTGYAHGVAGIALALFELYAATGDDQFQYASHQAIAYERHYYDGSRKNWPDFRHVPFSAFMTDRAFMSMEERFAIVDALEPFGVGFMSAWCHGAAGIVLARLRMYELSNDETYLDEAASGMPTILRDLNDDRWPDRSFCLCHGTAGDCETLLLAADLLHDVDARDTVRRLAKAGSERFELAGVPWKSGARNAPQDPSLMLGDAGIGYFYLRLAALDVPSIVSVTPDVHHPMPARAGARDSGAAALKREYVEQHFGDIIRVLQRLDGDAARDDGPSWVAPSSSDAERRYEAIVQRIDRETDDDVREKLHDAFAMERLRFEAAAHTPYRCDVVIEALQRGPVAPSLSDGTVITLSKFVRLVDPEWDWARWLADRSLPLAGVPRRAGTVTVIWMAGDAIRIDQLSPLSVAIVERLADAGAATVEEIVGAIASSLAESAESSSSSTLTTAVTMQLMQMKDASLIEFRTREPVDQRPTSGAEAYA